MRGGGASSHPVFSPAIFVLLGSLQLCTSISSVDLLTLFHQIKNLVSSQADVFQESLCIVGQARVDGILSSHLEIYFKKQRNIRKISPTRKKPEEIIAVQNLVFMKLIKSCLQILPALPLPESCSEKTWVRVSNLCRWEQWCRLGNSYSHSPPPPLLLTFCTPTFTEVRLPREESRYEHDFCSGSSRHLRFWNNTFLKTLPFYSNFYMKFVKNLGFFKIRYRKKNQSIVFPVPSDFRYNLGSPEK